MAYNAKERERERERERAKECSEETPDRHETSKV
jgi:hypothetical protein